MNRKNIRNIEEIRAKADIHSTLAYLGIDTQGQKMICCPLHKENTASFSIYSDDKKWTCFGECGTGGDSIRLVQLYKGINYYEAVQEVGNLVGIQPDFSNMSETELAEMQSKSRIESILHALNEFFSICWYPADGSQSARDYYTIRGLEQELINIYSIGYAPWDYKAWLLDLAQQEDVTIKELVEYGLLGSEDKENPTEENTYCRLRNCITFPIIVKNKVVGLIGRNIDDNAPVKYMKTSGFGLWNSNIVSEDEEVHVFEGIFDSLTAIQCGVPNVLALLGTNALGSKEEEILKKAGKVYLHLDSDEAGEKASNKIAKRLGYKAYIVPSITTGDTKDLNGLYNYIYELEKEKIEGFNYEPAYKNTIEMILKNLQNRIDKAENLITIEFDKWRDTEDEIERAENLGKLIELAYTQYNGNPELLKIFARELKEFGINQGSFNEYLKKIKKEVSLEPVEYGQGITIPEWEVIDGTLIKNVFDMRFMEYRQDPVTQTVPQIDKVLVNVETNLSEIEISYIDTRGNLRKEVINDISTRKGILDALRGKNFDINESNVVDIMNYLRYINLQLGADVEVENITERFGWHHDYKTFILGNDVLGEQVVTFKGAGLGEEQEAEAYTTKGTLDGWKEIIPLIQDKKLMMFELYTSFLPPLLPILEQNNFVLSNFGDTSSGKTLTNRVAGSVWGNTDKNSNIESSIYDGNHMTLDKLEKSIALHTHIPLFINDSHNMRKNVVSKMMYFIESGKGGGRGGVGRGSRDTKKLRTILYTTSESPLLNDGASKNKGELARGFEFHGSPLEEKNINLVLKIEGIMENNYGHAGRLYIQSLIDKDGNFEDIINHYKKIKNNLVDETQSNILNRLIPDLAGVIVAGILANEILDLGLSEEKIIEDVMSCIEIVKEEIDDVPYHVTALETVADFLITYKNMFYYQGYADPSSDIEQEKATKEVYGNQKFGVWRDDEGYIGVVKTELEKFLKQEGVDPNRCYRGWKEDGYIDTDKKGFTKQVYDPQIKSNVRMVKFNLDMLVDYIGETKKPEYPIPRNLRLVTDKDIEEVFKKVE